MTCRAALPTYSIGMPVQHTRAHTSSQHAQRSHGDMRPADASHGKWSHFSYGTFISEGGGKKTFSSPKSTAPAVIVLVVGKRGSLTDLFFFLSTPRSSAPLRRSQFLRTDCATRRVIARKKNVKTLRYSCFLINMRTVTGRLLWPKSTSSCQLCLALAMRGFSGEHISVGFHAPNCRVFYFILSFNNLNL